MPIRHFCPPGRRARRGGPAAGSVTQVSVALAVGAAITLAACGAGESALPAGSPTVGATAAPPTPSPTPTAVPLPDRAMSRSTRHPDPCGVDDGRDGIEDKDHNVEAPANRVEAAAKQVFGGRFLGVYIANVPQQYGVGVGVHRFTERDADAFFGATCFRPGDVVFESGPVSAPRLRAWRAQAEDIVFGDQGGCTLSEDWRTGRINVGLDEGDHPKLRRRLARAIPAEHLSIHVGGCPAPA